MFSFGSDPEVFISSNGKIINAINVLPNKENKISRGYTSIYYDNVLAEMQITLHIQHLKLFIIFARHFRCCKKI